MGWIDSLKNLRKAKAKDYPRATARVSRDEADGIESINSLVAGVGRMAAKFPFEFYEVMDDLFLFEPYCVKYLHTTLALGNTGHDLEIYAPTEQIAKKAADEANNLAARCFPLAGGMDGLVNGLISQTARSGALCPEWVPDNKITRVQKACLVPIKTIKFKRGGLGDPVLCQSVNGKLVPLNMVQTHFSAVAVWDSNPYPIPPALSALKSLAKLAKFDASMDGWLEKIGGLGVFLANLDPPPRGAETEEEYNAKSQKYLDEIAGTVRDNLKSGFAAGYNNVQFKFQNTSAGAAGAKDLLQMVLQGLFAGMQRDPVWFGWNWNSTETYAKVVYEELLAGVLTNQLVAKRALEHGHRLNFALLGLGDVAVSVKFKPNRSLDAFMGAEAKLMESNAIRADFSAGICDIEEARTALGYDKSGSESDAFIASFNRKAGGYKLAIPKRRIFAGGLDKIASINQRQRFLNAGDEQKRLARSYLFKIRATLKTAAKAGMDALFAWAVGRQIAEPEVFVAKAVQAFAEGAESSINEKSLVAVAKEHLTEIWKLSKGDKKLFDWDKGGRSVGVVFGEPDRAAVAYMSEKVDKFYVSKYISHSPTRSKQIANFIQRHYLERGLGTGGDPKDLDIFKEKFTDLTDRISTQSARVIVDTAVARAQNWSHVFSLDEEGFTEFKVAGPDDRITCRYCRAMLGRVFSVQTERRRIDRIVENGEEDIAKFDPFISSRFGGKQGLSDLKVMTDADVQKSGVVAPPFHCLCRHRIVAVV